MAKVFNTKEWVLEKGVLVKDLLADITVHINYPDYEPFLHLKPKQRIKQIGNYFTESLQKLLELKLFADYAADERSKPPRWIKINTDLKIAEEINKLDFVTVRIDAIDKGIKVKQVEDVKDRFYCIKMTVVIRYEGLKVKKEDIEQRFVLVKASSHDHAYEILEKSRDDYAVPYLNHHGLLVKWEIESFDDSFDTGILDVLEFDNPEGVEVFSVFKKRKAKNAVVWDGK